jgi:protein-S-isoprenylcysteine O-methyltransferase Ste14
MSDNGTGLETRTAMDRFVHVAALPLWLAVYAHGNVGVAFSYFLASRLAYVLFAGFSLRAQDESQWWTRRWGPVEGFRRFRRSVSMLMTNDGASIVILCWLSRDTLRTSLPEWATIAIGLALVALGIGVKSWAVSCIGSGSYFWESFFVPPGNTRYVATGPYRWFVNPMYTVGYSQAYGVALVLRSPPGLVAAFVAQSLMIAFNRWAEHPHTEKMKLRSSGAGNPGD